MPAVSKRQFRAMQAAAHGKGRLGIPRKVGKEFASATKSYSALPARVRKAKSLRRPSGFQRKQKMIR